ncbi:hypothetical protein GYA19_00470 [Candidatus Beckwithbacteria bacterium]|nr:hypothetical protein [Candidatus Beckwithbacteria bacterium]
MENILIIKHDQILDRDSLKIACQTMQYLDEITRYCMGWLSNTQGKERVYGNFGIQLISPKTNEVVAMAGFDLTDNGLIITNSPQGTRGAEVSRKGKSFLLNSNFRELMIEKLKLIAKKLGYKKIFALPFDKTLSVEIGLHDQEPNKYDLIRKNTDELYVRLGFTMNNDLYWELSID